MSEGLVSVKTKVFRLSGLVLTEMGVGSVLGRTLTTPSVGSRGGEVEVLGKGQVRFLAILHYLL